MKGQNLAINPLCDEIIKCVDKILEIKACHTERELVSQNIETELVILSDSEKSLLESILDSMF